MSFVGSVFRHTPVRVDVNSIELTASDSIWTASDGMTPQFGGVYIEIYDRTAPSHVSVTRCRFIGQVRKTYMHLLLLSLSLKDRPQVK